MADLLTLDEIDQLLAAINGSDYVKPVYTASGKRVRTYDFRRPDKFTKDNIDTFNIVHKELAEKLTSLFSDYLGSTVHIQVESVDQLTYEEFISTMPTPACLSIINLHPLKGSAMIEIDQTVSHSIIDILFGGNGDNIEKNDELTVLEEFVIGKLIVRSFDAIHDSWKKIIEFKPELVAVETIPRDVKILPPVEMTVLVTFGCKINNNQGLINILYPSRVINPIKNKVTSQYYNSGVEVMNEPLKTYMDQITIPVSVMIGEKSFPLKTIKELEVGNILELDKAIDKDMDIYAGGVIIARGEVVAIDDKFGIKITELGESDGKGESK
jgi:flagellar motor switch protein FliM